MYIIFEVRRNGAIYFLPTFQIFLTLSSCNNGYESHQYNAVPLCCQLSNVL